MPAKDANKMGKWGATSYIIGNIVGSGIFITPTSILHNASSMGVSLIIWAFSAVIATLGAYCYIELGTSIRKSGADFAYQCHVKWKAIAFAFMATGCILTYPCTLAVQSQTFGEYIIQGFGLGDSFSNPWHRYALQKLIWFSLVWLLLFLNFFSLHIFVARFQMAASLAKLVATGIIIVTGAYILFIKQDFSNLKEPFANSTLEPGKIVNAFFAGLFSYDGWDILNLGVEEVENPRVAMSFAILVGMTSIALIFLAVNVSYFAVLTVQEIKTSEAVAMMFAERTLGPLQYAIPFLISILLIGSLNSTLFAASRYLYAASRERQFPAFINCVNQKHDSPRAALFLHVVLAMAFSFLGDLEELIEYLGFSQWIMRLFTMGVLLYIRIWNKPVHPDAIRTPLIIPIIFMLICFTLVVVTILQSFKTASMTFIFLALGFIIYYLFLWEKSFQRFAWFQRFTSFINFSLCVGTQVIFNGLIEVAPVAEEESYGNLTPSTTIYSLPNNILNENSLKSNSDEKSLDSDYQSDHQNELLSTKVKDANGTHVASGRRISLIVNDEDISPHFAENKKDT